jgi:hypothetical protein
MNYLGEECVFFYYRTHGIRHSHGLHAFIDKGMNGETRGDQTFPGLLEDTVLKVNGGFAELADAGTDNDEIVIRGGRIILGARLYDRQEITLLFTFRVRKIQGPEIFCTGRLEPGEIISVIGDSHLVSIAVAYPVFEIVVLHFRPVNLDNAAITQTAAAAPPISASQSLMSPDLDGT